MIGHGELPQPPLPRTAPSFAGPLLHLTIDGDLVVIVEHMMSFPSPQWPARELASFDTPSIRQPSPAMQYLSPQSVVAPNSPSGNVSICSLELLMEHASAFPQVLSGIHACAQAHTVSWTRSCLRSADVGSLPCCSHCKAHSEEQAALQT